MPSLASARAALAALTGHPLTAVGRAATLAWFTFGDEVPWVDYRGELTTRPELSLHLQCRWRLVRGAAVLVQEGDLYVPGARAGAAFAAGAEIGTARFDDRVDIVAPIISAEVPIVEHVRIGDEFDLQLALSSGMSLEVFPEGRPGREDWRFLSKAGDSCHYVVENGVVSVV